jgi:tetratricopeptide (TPR) repeat protein
MKRKLHYSKGITMRATTTAILTIIICNILVAQTNEPGAAERISQAKAIIQRGVNTANQDLLATAENLLSHVQHDSRFSALGNYYLGYVAYRRTVVLRQVDKDRAVAYLDTAVSRLQDAISKDNTFAEAYALLASCYGLKISFSPIKGIYLGPRSNAALHKAKELAPMNPRVALVSAISTYNTPDLFGGIKVKGLEELKRAVELFDQWTTVDSLQPDWGKDEVWVWIGIAHMDRTETIQAKRAFDKALEINPDNGWVKHVLLPKLAAQAEAK